MNYTKEEFLEMLRGAMYDECRDVFVIKPPHKVGEKKTLSDKIKLIDGYEACNPEDVKEAIKELLDWNPDMIITGQKFNQESYIWGIRDTKEKLKSIAGKRLV